MIAMLYIDFFHLEFDFTDILIEKKKRTEVVGMNLKYAYQDPDRKGIYQLCSEEEANAFIVNKKEYTEFWKEYTDILDRFESLSTLPEVQEIQKRTNNVLQKMSKQEAEDKKILSEKKDRRAHYYILREQLVEMMKARKGKEE